jgi:Ca-activated chloride channel family protein
MPAWIASFFVRCFAVLACLLVAVPAHAADAPKARVVIVLDASGSMWGQVDGTPKITIARNVIHNMMKNWDKSIDLGLIVYGSRRKGDCDDIQTLVPVGPADPKAIDKAVDSLNPKGMTPLTAAVKHAAEDLKYTEQAATVILVSDGLETCNADPCAAAAALEKAGVNFTAHVIGFGLKEAEQKKLRCLADKTGGLFLPAKDASTLQASLSTAVETAKKETAPPPKPKVTGLHFKLLYATGGPPVKNGASWTVYAAQKDMEGHRKKITHSYDIRPEFKLDSGDYVIEVKVGNATVNKDFTVKAGEGQNITVVLNAGLAALSAKRAKDGDTISGLSWTVRRAAADINGKHKRVAHSYDAKPLFTLPAGKYLVSVKKGHAKTEGEITVTAGQRAEQVFVIGSGILAAKAKLAESGGPVKGGLSWTVFEAKTNIDGKHKRVAHSYDTAPSWEMPQGNYLLTVKRGQASTRKPVSVTTNQRTDATLVLNAGVLALKASGGKPKRWEVHGVKKDIDGKRKHFGGSYDAAPSWTLPAGSYHVTLKSGDKTVEKDVTVTAGQRTEATLNVK